MNIVPPPPEILRPDTPDDIVKDLADCALLWYQAETRKTIQEAEYNLISAAERYALWNYNNPTGQQEQQP